MMKPDLLLEVRPLERMRPVSPNSFVSPVSVDRSHFFTVLIRAAASLKARSGQPTATKKAIGVST